MYNSTYVKTLAAELHRQHLTTKIVCCDSDPGIPFGEWSIADAIALDPALKQSISAIGVHYPRETRTPPLPENARNAGLPLWSSEDQPNPGGGPYLSRDWKIGGRILAHQYNINYLEDRFTKTEIWSPVTAYYDILAAPNSGLMYANTPWSGHYEVQGAIWATAHTTQFASPGWQYLDSASGRMPGVGSYVSLRSPNHRDWSVVLETIEASQPQRLAFHLGGGLATSQVHVWETNDTRTFEHVADVAVKGGVFSYTFEPGSLYSLTTTVGQGKGSAVPPSTQAFPFPYVDDFEHTTLERSPRFLADQDGAFEVRQCQERNGQCLEQVITQKPIPWSPSPPPFSIAGSVDWKDYRLSVDIHLPHYGTATLMARIDSANVFEDGAAPYPSGYVLEVADDGHWSLFSTAYKKPTVTLASGVTTGLDRGWHRLELRCEGEHIEARLNAKALAMVVDKSHAHGMIGVGSDWSHVQFDNLAVTASTLP
jgi:hypothetical protein